MCRFTLPAGMLLILQSEMKIEPDLMVIKQVSMGKGLKINQV